MFSASEKSGLSPWEHGDWPCADGGSRWSALATRPNKPHESLGRFLAFQSHGPRMLRGQQVLRTRLP